MYRRRITRRRTNLRPKAKPYRRWTVASIVSELQRLHRDGVRMTANAIIANGHTGLASAIRNYIGSFERARRLARIPSPAPRALGDRERWDEDRVVGVILQRHRAGEPLAYKQVPSKLVDAALYYYGSWREAIAAAGLDYGTIRRSSPAWTRAEIIATLRASAKSTKRGIGEDRAIDSAVSLAARREFGSLRAAIDAAKIAPQRLLRRTTLNDRELATALRRMFRKRRNMTQGDLTQSALGRVLKRRFGTHAQGLHELHIMWTPKPTRRGANLRKLNRRSRR